jgi:hypothetical protein
MYRQAIRLLTVLQLDSMAPRRPLRVRVPLITLTPSAVQREPVPVDRIATCRAPSTGTIRRSTDPTRGRASPQSLARVFAGQNPGVVLPAFCDTSPWSVGQRFRRATTCAARDLIADVSAHLCSHHALTPHTPDGHTSRGRGCIGRADRERKMHTKQPNVAEPKRRVSPESESPPKMLTPLTRERRGRAAATCS